MQAASRVSPSRRPATTTQLADSLSATSYSLAECGRVGQRRVDLGHADVLGCELAGQRGQRGRDRRGEQVGAVEGGNGGQAADVHRHASAAVSAPAG